MGEHWERELQDRIHRRLHGDWETIGCSHRVEEELEPTDFLSMLTFREKDRVKTARESKGKVAGMQELLAKTECKKQLCVSLVRLMWKSFDQNRSHEDLLFHLDPDQECRTVKSSRRRTDIKTAQQTIQTNPGISEGPEDIPEGKIIEEEVLIYKEAGRKPLPDRHETLMEERTGGEELDERVDDDDNDDGEDQRDDEETDDDDDADCDEAQSEMTVDLAENALDKERVQEPSDAAGLTLNINREKPKEQASKRMPDVSAAASKLSEEYNALQTTAEASKEPSTTRVGGIQRTEDEIQGSQVVAGNDSFADQLDHVGGEGGSENVENCQQQSTVDSNSFAGSDLSVHSTQDNNIPPSFPSISTHPPTFLSNWDKDLNDNRSNAPFSLQMDNLADCNKSKSSDASEKVAEQASSYPTEPSRVETTSKQQSNAAPIPLLDILHCDSKTSSVELPTSQPQDVGDTTQPKDTPTSSVATAYSDSPTPAAPDLSNVDGASTHSERSVRGAVMEKGSIFGLESAPCSDVTEQKRKCILEGDDSTLLLHDNANPSHTPAGTDNSNCSGGLDKMSSSANVLSIDARWFACITVAVGSFGILLGLWL